jgi:hypothetical protein
MRRRRHPTERTTEHESDWRGCGCRFRLICNALAIRGCQSRIVGDDIRTHLDTFIAYVRIWTGDQFSDIIAALVAERTPKWLFLDCRISR